ncbi:MAG: RagB/SusD family nutrient uptake outer membrane protein [Flavitalea sp.]
MRNIFLSIIALLALASCAKQLEEKPKSIAAEVFYNTPAEVESGLNAIYEPVRGVGSFGALYPIQLEIYTEYMYGRGSHAPLNTYTGLDNTNIGRIAGMWNLFYRAIRNANIVILRAPEATQVSAEGKTRYLAEAKFLRALWYFHLVRNWAGVPIRTELNMDSISLRRNSQQEVYDLILSDLQTAVNDLPDAPRLIGSPSKWSAKTLLADVYMNTGNFTGARQAALEVIQSNKYSLVPVSVAADFNKIFGPDVVNSSEEIFYLKYSNKVAGQGNQYPAYEHYPNSGYYPPAGFYTLYSDSDKNLFAKNWDRSDLRYDFNWYTQAFGLGATTILGKKFSDPTATNSNFAGNDYPMYRYADLLLFYAECDAREAGSVTVDALEKLNMVHRRAYGKPVGSPDATDITLASVPTLESFIDRIVKERAYENINEGKHWFDLKRLGKVKQVIQEIKGIAVADKHLLWPIPTDETNYNPAINPATDQNPGY